MVIEMVLVILEGKNHTECCKIDDNTMAKKRFYSKDEMMYRVFPEQLTRLRTYRYGEDMGTEACIVYQVNCIHAQQERGYKVHHDLLMAEMDEYKHKYHYGKKVYAPLKRVVKRDWFKIGTWLLVGGIIAYALIDNFLKNGMVL